MDNNWSAWHDWNGGKQPVDSGSVVQVEFDTGLISKANAGVFDWGHIGAADIIRYRYKQPALEPDIKPDTTPEQYHWDDPTMTEEEDRAWAEKFGNDVSDADMVNHPPHYQSESGIECIDAIRAALGKEGFIAYCRGNAIKYQWRMKSNPAEDQAKSAWYANKAREALEE